MATQQIRPLEWTICLGRNGWDSPLAIPDDMAVECLNWVFTGALGKKRDGSALVTLTGDAFTQPVQAMASFVPGQDDTLSQLFLVSNDGTPKILRVPIAAAINLTLADNIATAPQQVTFVTHNGKLFIAYDSTVNRLHEYDPASSTTATRRGGLAAPAAPTVADTGSGSYAATPRYYRVQYRTISGTTVLRQSNLGPSVNFTPSGSGLAARVTKPAAISEGETHWRIYGSTDDATYYGVGPNIPVGTTTFDDTSDPASYNLSTLAPLEGANTPFPSVKFLGSDGLHLFGLGVWETTAGDSLAPMAGRVYFTPALGTSTTGDDERVSDTLTIRGYLDVSPNGGGVDRGISGPMNNRMYLFQSRGIYMFVPTGDPITPFARVVITTAYGSVSHWSQVIGEDETGQPSLYFLDPNDGPRRISVGRTVDWMGKDVYDVWQTVNLNATGVIAHGVYHAQKKLVIWWVSTGANNTPDTMIVLDVTRGRAEAVSLLRYGWAKWSGALAAATASVMFSPTLGAARSSKRVPYAGLTAGTLIRQDATLNTDAGTAFQAYVTSKPFTGGTLRRLKRLMEAFLLAKASVATITQSIVKNFSESTATSTQSLAASGTETRVRKFFDATDVANLAVVQIQLGDGSALDQTFELDQWIGGDEIEQGAR